MEKNIKNFLETKNLRLASKTRRIAAYAIDTFLLNMIFVIIHIDMIMGASPGSVDNQALAGTILDNYMWQYILLKVAYESFFVWQYNASIGKVLLRIKIIDINHGRLTLSNSIIRSTLKLLGEFVFYLSYFVAFIDSSFRALHDRPCKTLVVAG